MCAEKKRKTYDQDGHGVAPCVTAADVPWYDRMDDRQDRAARCAIAPAASALEASASQARGHLVFRAQQSVQKIELLHPEALVETQPRVSRGKRRGLDTAHVSSPLYAPAHQARLLKDLHVLGGSGKGHAVRGSERADVALSGRQSAQHRAARPIGKRMKNAVESRGAFFHDSEAKAPPAKDQPLGLIALRDPC